MSAVNIQDFNCIGLCGHISPKKQHALCFMYILMFGLKKYIYRARGLTLPPLCSQLLKISVSMQLRQQQHVHIFFLVSLNCLCSTWSVYCCKEPLFCKKSISLYVSYMPSCECSPAIKNPISASILCQRSLTGNLRQQLIRYCQSEVRKTCHAPPDLDWHGSREETVDERGALCFACAYVCIRLHSA